MAVIVVGYVPKPEGHAALRHAADEARLRSARLVVVDVQRDTPAPLPDDEVRTVTAQLDHAGVAHEVRPADPTVEPAEQLIAIAEQDDAALIVIGLRRRSRVGKLILGSNAQRILLDASCPVLAVKAGD